MGLAHLVATQKKLENTNISLWFNGTKFDMTITEAENMLAELENYAYLCYNTTEEHLLLADKIETLDEVSNFDIQSGYPEKLRF